MTIGALSLLTRSRRQPPSATAHTPRSPSATSDGAVVNECEIDAVERDSGGEVRVPQIGSTSQYEFAVAATAESRGWAIEPPQVRQY
jgi:hypothetical protein